MWGSAGGARIPDYVSKALLGYWVCNMELQAALNADNWAGQQDSIAELESGKSIASLQQSLRNTYGYTRQNIRVAALTSGLAGIAVTYNSRGIPSYHGAADNRRNGAGAGY